MSKNISIVLVDDHTVVRNGLKSLIERMGNYTISYQFENGKRFIEEIPLPEKPDLVIMDLTMPEMNGVELARKIHEIRPELPIVLASGFNAGLDLAKLGECGIHSLLEKPVSLTALTQLLEEKNLASKK